MSDQLRSIAFYQRLFGMRVDTYQGPLPILRVGAGNQFLALVGGSGRRLGPTIHHACLTVNDFDPDRVLGRTEMEGTLVCLRRIRASPRPDRLPGLLDDKDAVFPLSRLATNDTPS